MIKAENMGEEAMRGIAKQAVVSHIESLGSYDIDTDYVTDAIEEKYPDASDRVREAIQEDVEEQIEAVIAEIVESLKV